MRRTLSSRIVCLIYAAALLSNCTGCSEGTNEAPQAAGSAPGVRTAQSPGHVSTVALSPSGIDLAKLPVPSGAKPLVVSPDVAMYVTETAVEPTAREIAKLLQAEGWTPYGSVEGTQDFKRNLVRLMASTGSAPAQGGKTMISYIAQKIAVDLPAPADAQGLQYSDSTKQVSFDTSSSLADVETYYRSTLGKSDWKATTDRPFKIDFKDELIFRNPAKDMLTLQMNEVEGKRRVSLKHLSAAEVAEQEARFQAELEQKKKDEERPLPKIKLAVPAAAQAIEQRKNRLNFEVATGQAKGIVDAWRKQLTSAGWTEDVTKLEDKIGDIAFRNEKQFLSVDYLDPGFIPAEITVTATGVELEK
ncbi:MAG: hypothetical protein K8U03_21220 [Planctomycetia bacterium]|nr:hypothetical protein [Planctomycetia bacterium]